MSSRTTSSAPITRSNGLSKVAVTYALAALQPQAEKVAAHLKIPLVDKGDGYDYLLRLTEAHLQLEQPNTRIGAVYADFVGGKAGHRFRHGGGRGQLIARAVGLSKGRTPRVLDLTAGLGRDAFVLASLGCSVEMVERSPIVAALLEDGLQRAADESAVVGIIARMMLVEADAADYLQRVNLLPDVCYIDPMYPHSRKSALPGKEMLLFRSVVGEDQDSGELLGLAQRVARKRVVVKRPRKAVFLNDAPPDFQIRGKSTRYDIYLPANQELQ